MSDLLTTPELKQEAAREPAKRWRNWWRAHTDAIDFRLGALPPTPRKIGDVWAGHRLFPSRDTAETAAQRCGQLFFTYLGAFPEGERP